VSRYGKRNGAPDPKFGMRGRNDGAIRRARLGAKMRGHKLKPGHVAPATNQHREMFYAWCRCGTAVVVEDGYQPRGSALDRSCDGVDRSIGATESPDSEAGAP
jgi:hypothetical protein